MLEHLPEASCSSNIDSQSGNLLLLLLNTLLASQCELQNPNNFPPDSSSKIQDGAHFDFIVVGTGSSGSVVATRLVETGKFDVLVVEAGGIPSVTSEIPGLWWQMPFTDQVWNYSAEPSNSSSLALRNGTSIWPRGKLLGGCSAINTMMYVRGNRGDYTPWSEKGDKNWSYEKVLKSYKKIEKFDGEDSKHFNDYGRDGSLHITRNKVSREIEDNLFKSVEQLGFTVLDEEGPKGFFKSLLTVHKGVRVSSAKAFLGSVTDSDRIALSLNTSVQKLIMDDTRKEAKGVEVKIGDKKLKIFAKKEIILSAGVINTPKILMLSGIGPKEHLEHSGVKVVQDLKVGENLQDHLMVFLYSKINDNALNNFVLQDEIYKYFAHREGLLGNPGLLNMQGLVNTKNNSDYPDIKFMYTAFRKNDVQSMEVLLRMYNIDPAIAENLEGFVRLHNLLVTSVILLKPKSRGKIVLRSDRPDDPPLIHTGYLSDDDGEDLDTMLRGIRIAEAQLETQALKELNATVLDIGVPNCKGFEFKSDDYWRCYTRNLGTTAHHQTSTCKMGPQQDEEAVVDTRLRVHGVKNLRVVDASMMPSAISANTNGPCMMIGQRGAEMIIEDHREIVHGEL